MTLRSFSHYGIFGPDAEGGGPIHTLPLYLYLPLPLELQSPRHPLPNKTSKIYLPGLSHIVPLPFSLCPSKGKALPPPPPPNSRAVSVTYICDKMPLNPLAGYF